MTFLACPARIVAALGSLYLCLVAFGYLSECVPDTSFNHEITRLWWGRGTETTVLKEREWLTPPDHGYAEKGYDIRYTFRLTEGAVLEMQYFGSQIIITEADLCGAADASPADGSHTLDIGLGREELCLLDGKALPACCFRNKPGKGVCLHNAGTGEIVLEDLLVEFPQGRNPRPLNTREAPRTAQELLHRSRIWARYLIYSEAPPPLPIR